MFVGFLLIASFVDIQKPPGSLWPKTFKARSLPIQKAYERLSKLPKGLLLELPIFPGSPHAIETSYLSHYYQPIHQNVIVNPLHTPKTIEIRQKAVARWNQMQANDLEVLRKAGLRYIAVHPSRKAVYRKEGKNMNFSLLHNHPGLRLISQDEFTFIYEFKNHLSDHKDFIKKMKEAYGSVPKG